MINIDKNSCVGCEACVNICPVKCISMHADEEGFYYPFVHKEACIDCNLCSKVCPAEQHSSKENKAISTLAVISENEKHRQNSSSGGVFSLLADYVLEHKGVVYGAAFEADASVHHIRVDCMENMSKLRTSKYVQSHIDQAYSHAKFDLENGRLVLFTGTGCQLAGLTLFLQKDYENLIKVDVVCHGVPSEMVWKKYLKYRNAEYSAINFRDKNSGWLNYSVRIGENYFSRYNQDPYMKLFLWNVILRQSCYSCSYKRFNVNSDLTLADFWGIQVIDDSMFDDKGTSLVLINTEKGKNVFDEISDKCIFKKENFDDAVRYNPSIVKPVSKPESRKEFFEELNNTDELDFNKTADKYTVFYKAGFLQKMKIYVMRALKYILK